MRVKPRVIACITRILLQLVLEGNVRITMLLATGLLAGQIFAGTTSVEIKLKHDSAAETQTRQQLETLLQKYPLTPWYFILSTCHQ